MCKILKQYIENISNPLLYYIDKNGNSVFRNFCLFKNCGNSYNKVIPVKDAGKIIEYRIELARKLNLFNILITFCLYLLFIHTIYNIGGLLLCEFLLIISTFSARLYCSNIYKKLLVKTYGQYEIKEFAPNLPSEKKSAYKRNYLSRFLILLIFLVIFISFSSILKFGIRNNINKEQPNYKNAQILSKLYTTIYPKTAIIYEFNTFKFYNSGDFNDALSNYIEAMNSYGKKFTKNDYIRFANLLYLVKKTYGSQNAIDIFNEFYTKKKTNITQQTKLLWIKSMFSIANEVSDFVVNDYDDLIASLDEKDKNRFYIMSDKAYMLYLKQNYQDAVKIYNTLISYAKENSEFAKELPRLYSERGYAKKHLNDKAGSDLDFKNSKQDKNIIKKYEPQLIEPQFILYKI